MRALHLLAPFLALAAPSAGAEASVPLVLVANHGQARREALFLGKLPRMNVYFGRRDATLAMRGGSLRIAFEDAAGPSRVEPARYAEGEVNFLTGGEEEWITGLRPLDSIAYRDIYPGIDAIFRGSGPNLKSEYVVEPGSDPAAIRLRYAGADQLEVAADGSLAIRVGRHWLRESAPEIFQNRGGRRTAVDGAFAVSGDVVTFVVGGYDRSLPLIIDPLIYLTLFGGSGADAALSLAVDSAGSAYIAGFTSSYDLPVSGGPQAASMGGNEAFVAKLKADGTGLVYCTYIGGRGDDRAYGIAVDGTGAAYVAGSTTSANFPVRGAIQARLSGGKNAFALKLAPAGNALVYSTYLGGSGVDAASGIAVDASGNAYVAGDATSANFPATAFQRSNRGAPDGFVAKLSADGSRLVYSTYLGGSSEDHITAIAVDSSGSAAVTGSTYSADFPLAAAQQQTIGGGQDAFVAKLASDGASLIFSTFLGGSNGIVGAAEIGHGVAVDASGNVYVAGQTSSIDFPIRSAVQSVKAGWQDAFVSKFGPSGTLLYSTYIGGVNDDIANAVAVDRGGYAYIAGQTTSANLASLLVSQGAPTGIFDAFVVKLAPAGNAISGLAYLGGIGADNAADVAVDDSGNIYIAGWTQSPNFSTVNGFQTINGGNYSAFAGKLTFSAGGAAVTVTVSPAAASVSAGQTQQFAATVANASNTAVTWSISPVVGTISPSGLYTAPATVSTQQTVTVKATSVADATKSATASVTLLPPVSVSVAPSSVSLAGGAAQPFTATVSNASNTAVTWSISPVVGTISPSGLYTAPASVSTQQTVTVKATSVADATKSATATVTLLPPAFTPIRVNAGGGEYVDSQNRVWSADTGYDEGLRNSTTSSIGGTASPSLYQSEHYSTTGSLTYRFTVPNGAYSVTLKFAEIWYTSAGQRLFDVAVNGKVIRSSLDVYAAAGAAFTAFDLTTPVTVAAGQLAITLTAVRGLPKINAIEIVSATPDFALSTAQTTQTVPKGSTATYTVSVAPSGGFSAAVSLSVSGLPAGATAAFAPQSVTGAGTSTLTVATTSATPEGSYSLSVAATGGGFTRAAALTLVVASAQSPIRINAGGDDYIDGNGQTWSADTGYLQGFRNATGAPISGTASSGLYQTEHYSTTGTLTYRFDVANGARSVTLKFAEIWYTAPGQRVFDISINGVLVASRFDIFSGAGGAFKAYDFTQNVTATDGQVTITLTAIAGFPKINAIEIR